MIYFFLYYFSHHIIEFDERGKEMLINVYQFDYFEIKIKSNESVFFNWDNDNKFYLDIDVENSNGKIDSYGTFDHSSNLFGIYFRNNNCSLKFYNESPKMIRLALVFGLHYYKFPIFNNFFNIMLEDYFNFDQSKLESITNPLIYNYADENGYYFLVVMVPILLILYIIFVCCIKCDCC